MKKLVMMRGIPGSGKSTKAQEIARKHLENGGRSVAICSTDDYHMEHGEYVFKPKLLGEFHVKNQIRASGYMDKCIELVIVDNTNIKRKDMMVYINNGQSCGYEVEEVIVGKDKLFPDMDASAHDFTNYIDMCAARNTHGVPKDVIDRMARTFQK
tara:strand:+ start:19655 stop:20119 length:465 start_codon:yes stop_codon:yes gene_type:complete